MSRRARSAPTYLSIVVAAVLVVTSAPAPAQDVPGLPDVDDLPALPKAPTAVFDVIVEGEGEARRTTNIDGSTGFCFITSRTQSAETYDYGRGRGVRVRFTALGRGRRGVVLQRVGGRTPIPLFTVRGKVRRLASGTASRTGPAALCAPATEEVGDEPECGTRRRKLNYGLGYARGKLSLDPSGEPLPPLPSPSQCGATSLESLSGPPEWNFDSPPRLKDVALPRRLIFGRKRAFKRTLKAKPIDTEREATVPGFSGSTVEKAEHEATVRFVRVKKD